MEAMIRSFHGNLIKDFGPGSAVKTIDFVESVGHNYNDPAEAHCSE